MSRPDHDPLSAARLTGVNLPSERLAEVAAAFCEIRAEIEKLRTLDLGETHPAVVFRPVMPGEEA